MGKKKIIKLDLCYVWDGDLLISAVYGNGLFSIIGHPVGCEDNTRDIEWINGKFKSFRTIKESDERDVNKYESTLKSRIVRPHQYITLV